MKYSAARYHWTSSSQLFVTLNHSTITLPLKREESLGRRTTMRMRYGLPLLTSVGRARGPRGRVEATRRCARVAVALCGALDEEFFFDVATAVGEKYCRQKW